MKSSVVDVVGASQDGRPATAPAPRGAPWPALGTRRKIACALVSTLFVGGCHTYRPAPTTGIQPGREIRVALTDAGTLAVAPLVGPQVVAVAGRLLSYQDSALVLSVTSTTKRNGVEDPWRGETVTVRPEVIASLAERTFSWQRSAAAAGGFLAFGSVLYAALGGSGAGGSGRPGGSPPSGR